MIFCFIRHLVWIWCDVFCAAGPCVSIRACACIRKYTVCLIPSLKMNISFDIHVIFAVGHSTPMRLNFWQYWRKSATSVQSERAPTTSRAASREIQHFLLITPPNPPFKSRFASGNMAYGKSVYCHGLGWITGVGVRGGGGPSGGGERNWYFIQMLVMWHLNW